MNQNAYNSFNEACEGFIEHIARLDFPEKGIRSYDVETPPLPLLGWLAAQRDLPRYYWRDREGLFEMAGIGEAEVVIADNRPGLRNAVSRIRERICATTQDLRYYGGFRFHPGTPESGRWHDFKAYRFVLPLLEIRRENASYRLICNLCPQSDKQHVLSVLRRATSSFASELASLPAFSGRKDLPDQSGWHTIVAAALETINSSDIRKIVLARQSTFHAANAIDAVALTQHLAAKSTNTFLFCFEPAHDRAFAGASPERLYARSNHDLLSEALAGTRPRGATPTLDAVYEQELRGCDKEHREHQFVVNGIHDALKQCCSDIAVAPEPGIMKLAHCQHLHTPITGRLQDDVNDETLLEALHPTPAVGGTPRDKAVRWILEHEPFERGIYAAPVGWIGKDAAEFCVGIRSGLVRGNTLTLYSGAGIVTGADAANEWRELDAKLAGFLDVIMEEV